MRQRTRDIRFRITRSRRLTIALLVVAVLIVGLLVWVAFAKEARATASTAEACARVESERTAMGEVVTASEGSPTVAIVGDSYAAGDTLKTRSDSWAYQLGESEGWETHLAAIGGTGFVNGGYCGDDQVRERIDPALDSGASTLIVQAGINDSGKHSDEIRDALTAVLDETQSVERVIVIGPATSVKRPGARAVDDVMRETTEAANREYVSTLGWRLQFGPDELHMTPEGHADYAERVAAAL